jgi:CheY-like chemotaxis protein
VRDGEAALDYLFRRRSSGDAPAPPRPDLILLDLRLPKLDGFQLLQEIKKSPELSSIPAVILTTSQAESDVARAYSHGANSYLVKPVDFERFVGLIGAIGTYWLEWNRQPARPA